jgi:hypothetical protein
LGSFPSVLASRRSASGRESPPVRAIACLVMGSKPLGLVVKILRGFFPQWLRSALWKDLRLVQRLCAVLFGEEPFEGRLGEVGMSMRHVVMFCLVCRVQIETMGRSACSVSRPMFVSQVQCRAVCCCCRFITVQVAGCGAPSAPGTIEVSGS